MLALGEPSRSVILNGVCGMMSFFPFQDASEGKKREVGNGETAEGDAPPTVAAPRAEGQRTRRADSKGKEGKREKK